MEKSAESARLGHAPLVRARARQVNARSDAGRLVPMLLFSNLKMKKSIKVRLDLGKSFLEFECLVRLVVDVIDLVTKIEIMDLICSKIAVQIKFLRSLSFLDSVLIFHSSFTYE